MIYQVDWRERREEKRTSHEHDESVADPSQGAGHTRTAGAASRPTATDDAELDQSPKQGRETRQRLSAVMNGSPVPSGRLRLRCRW